MSGLEEQMLHSESAHVYKRLFPSYYETGLSKKGSPYLITDYIPGCTLEDILSSARVTSPQQILTSQQILQLFQQLDQAQSWLHKAGLIQMDLSPRNIIVCNHIQPELYSYDTLDIRLIDFTDAYYLSSEIRRKRDRWNRRHHLINGLADRSLPPDFQLQQTAALLFTYLFYKGQKDYEQHRPCEPFFDRYGSLLNCLRVRTAPSFFPNEPDASGNSDVSLSHWSDWLSELFRSL